MQCFALECCSDAISKCAIIQCVFTHASTGGLISIPFKLFMNWHSVLSSPCWLVFHLLNLPQGRLYLLEYSLLQVTANPALNVLGSLLCGIAWVRGWSNFTGGVNSIIHDIIKQVGSFHRSLHHLPYIRFTSCSENIVSNTASSRRAHLTTLSFFLRVRNLLQQKSPSKLKHSSVLHQQVTCSRYLPSKWICKTVDSI